MSTQFLRMQKNQLIDLKQIWRGMLINYLYLGLTVEEMI